MAEWLRRLTRNQSPSRSAGSNPADCVIFFPQRLSFEILTVPPTIYFIFILLDFCVRMNIIGQSRGDRTRNTLSTPCKGSWIFNTEKINAIIFNQAQTSFRGGLLAYNLLGQAVITKLVKEP